jgi:spermidine synthase
MTGAALAYAPGLGDAAIIGLGGGRTAWYLHKSVPDLSFTAVELDPEVARITDRYFGVRPEHNFDVQISDGRVWLTRTDRKFDIILVDAYRGPFVPFHLLTSEFYKLVADHLKPGGIAVQNVEPTTMLFDSAVATIRSAFAHTVFLYGGGNIVIVGYNGPEKDEATLQKIVAERQERYHFRYPLTDILSRRFQPALDDKTAPLTDDFAPVEYLKAIARHNERQT